MNIIENMKNSSSFLVYGDFRIIIKDKLENYMEDIFKIKNISLYPNYYYYEEIKISDVREIIKISNETSYYSGVKIFFIDNVEKLKKEALNAMLKILEEPPKNVYFFLLTKSLNILETIKSRCITINLTEKLTKIELENINIFNFFDNDIDSYTKYLSNIDEIKIENNDIKSLEEMLESIFNFFNNSRDLITKIKYYNSIKYLITNLKLLEEKEILEIKDKLLKILIVKDNKISRKNIYSFIKTINNFIINLYDSIYDIEFLITLKLAINSNVNLKLIMYLLIRELGRLDL